MVKRAIAAPLKASISKPVRSIPATSLLTRTLSFPKEKESFPRVIFTGWQWGMREGVFLKASSPATSAVFKTSPLGTLFSLILLSTAAGRKIFPSAIASLREGRLLLTSIIIPPSLAHPDRGGG